MYVIALQFFSGKIRKFCVVYKGVAKGCSQNIRCGRGVVETFAGCPDVSTAIQKEADL